MPWRASLAPLTAERLTSVCPLGSGTNTDARQASYINTKLKSNCDNRNVSRYANSIWHH